MGYYDYFCRQLRPLRLYDLEVGAGAEELKTAGAALDALAEALDEAEREGSLLTAEDSGLSAMEALLPYAPVSANVSDRRAAIAALLRIDGRSFTPAALCDTLSGCGVAATVRETETPFTVEVSFPDTMGEPDDFAQIRLRIEQILPCHLDVRYVLRYLLWDELESSFPTWAALEEAAENWDALEKFRAA